MYIKFDLTINGDKLISQANVNQKFNNWILMVENVNHEYFCWLIEVLKLKIY